MVPSRRLWVRRAGRYGTLYRRPGPGPRVLILPGLGCPATEYTGPASERLPPGWEIEVWEAPGAGTTRFRGAGQSTVYDLVDALGAVADRPERGDGRFVIGHSLGGLVGLLLCERWTDEVAGFVSVEGNLGPADCVFTAGAAGVDLARFQADWLPRTIERLARATTLGDREYAAALSHLSSPEAYHSHSRSIVAHSAPPGLVGRFLRLPMPKLYLHGAASGDPATVARLRGNCGVATIPGAGHFPHIDRPAVFWPLVEGWIEGVARAEDWGWRGPEATRCDGEARP